jgi:hypothetical protein
MTKKIALRVCLCAVLLTLATIPAYSQVDTTLTPTKLGFFAGPVFSRAPVHTVIGITLANDRPIALALYVDPADTTITITTSSAIRMATVQGWSLHTLIGGSLQLVDRPLTLDQQVTYLLLTTGLAIERHLYDSAALILAANWRGGPNQSRPMTLTIALHFNIGNR